MLIFLIFHIMNKSINKIRKHLFKIRKRIYSNEINYKGHKILKSKLIDDYLSKISEDYNSEKIHERELFNNYYYLANFYNDSLIKTELREALLIEVSRIKKQIIKRIDILFISYILNFGNNLLVINNAIFFCEIVGFNAKIKY